MTPHVQEVWNATSHHRAEFYGGYRVIGAVIAMALKAGLGEDVAKHMALRAEAADRQWAYPDADGHPYRRYKVEGSSTSPAWDEMNKALVASFRQIKRDRA